MRRQGSYDSSDQLYDGSELRQHLSQKQLGVYLEELSDMIDDIMTLIDHLHSLNEEEVSNYFTYLKKQLRILKL